MEKVLCVTTAAAKDITPKIAAHRRAKASLKARAKTSAKDLAQAKAKARARAKANRMQVCARPVAKSGIGLRSALRSSAHSTKKRSSKSRSEESGRLAWSA